MQNEVYKNTVQSILDILITTKVEMQCLIIQFTSERFFNIQSDLCML